MSVLDNYSCEGQMSIFDMLNQDSLCGKTSPEPLVQTKEKTSGVSLKSFAELRIKPPMYLCLKKENGQIADVSWVTGGALLGVFTIASFGESPSVGVESRLSEILEVNPPQKYCLSARACQGILNRAEKRGKKLPPQLEMALRRQAGYKESEISYTLNSTEVHGVCHEEPVLLANNQNQAEVSQTGICNTLPAAMGMGGGYVPMVLEGNGSRPSHMGDGWHEGDPMYALNSTEHHAVCYRGDAITSPVNASNPKPGDPCHTLTDDSRNYVVEVQSLETFHCTNEQDKVQTLKARDYKDPQIIAYGIDRASFNQGINAKYDFAVDEEKIATQVAKGPGAVCTSVVRRLTPLECERLQGYPVVRKLRFTEMTKDEYIAWNINEGNIIVDTEYGKVFATRGPGGIKLGEPRELTGTTLNGYRVVSIRNGETKMQCRVHRIVWIAEHGIIPDGYVIDHINNDKQDNRLCNLQLLTAAENSTKARGDGLYKIHDDAGQAKITDEVHDFIQYIYGNSDLSIRQLSEIFGISKSRVHQIIHDEPWTDIGDWVDSKGKTHKGESDSPRYKALGNSIALPFWEWMAARMVKILKDDGVEHPTMASLFDGIGGFPLVFGRNGCKPLWASEIEEFPIAVTKIRFPGGAENDNSRA